MELPKNNVMENNMSANLKSRGDLLKSEKDILNKPSKKKNLMIVALIFMACFVLVLIFYVSRNNGLDLLSQANDDKCVMDINDYSSDFNESEWTTLTWENYAFALKIPAFSLEEEVTLGEETRTIESKWHVSEYKNEEMSHLNGYLTSLSIEAKPSDSDFEWLACDSQCEGYLHIGISIYDNSSNDSLETVKNKYTENWNEKYGNDGNLGLTDNSADKWGIPVWKFVETFPMGSEDIYLVVKDNYAYEISINLAFGSQVETAQQRILDSMSFEK